MWPGGEGAGVRGGGGRRVDVNLFTIPSLLFYVAKNHIILAKSDSRFHWRAQKAVLTHQSVVLHVQVTGVHKLPVNSTVAGTELPCRGDLNLVRIFGKVSPKIRIKTCISATKQYKLFNF